MSSLSVSRQFPLEDFFGLKEAAAYFGILPNRRQIDAFESLPSEEMLARYWGTHFLVAYVPVSILTLIKKLPDAFLYDLEQAWYKDDPIIRRTCAPGWYFVKKEPTREETLPASLQVYAALGQFLKTGKEPYFESWTNCSEVDQWGKHFCIAYYYGKLYITWDPRMEDNS